jgi:nucleotidyltransferase substrate binding protein (TIGR01987 family)
MELNEKYAQQLIEVENALIDFRKALDANMNKYDDLEQNWIKNAQVQKFEFCIELLWKTAKSYFEMEGEAFLSPKQNIKALFLHNLLDEEQYLELMRCIESRNLLSHIYKSETFELITNELFSHYEIMYTSFLVLKNKV